MNYELLLYSPLISPNELQRRIFEAVQYSFSVIASPLGYSSLILAYQTSFEVAAVIDFPYGNSSLQNKLRQVIESAELNVNIFDLTVNQYSINNSDWKAVIQELKSIAFLNKTYKKRVRLIIDFNQYTNENLISLVKICEKMGIKEIITSTGLNIDDYLDNLTVAAQLKKYGITPVFTLYNHHRGHIIDLETAGITNVRLLNTTRMNSISI